MLPSHGYRLYIYYLSAEFILFLLLIHLNSVAVMYRAEEQEQL